jgi:hypothetical protein
MAPVRVNVATTADALADTILAAGLTTRKPLVIQGKASQTANLTQWQNSSGFPLTTIASDGSIQWGGGAGAVDTYLYRNAAGQVRTAGSFMVDTTIFSFANITSNFVAGTEVQVGGVDDGTGPKAGLRMGGDTFLYRSAAGAIKMPADLLVAGGDLTIDEAGAGAQTPSLTLSSNSTAGPTLTTANSFDTLVLNHAYGTSTDMSFRLGGVEWANLSSAGLFKATTLVEKKVTFTPTTIGWYRIVAGTNYTGGVIRLQTFIDNADVDHEFQYMIGGYGVGGSVQQTRHSTYNNAISQVRISSDGGSNVYLDIYVGTATIPAPITVYAYGPRQAALVASPVVGAVVGSTNAETLTFGHGFRTTDDLLGTTGYLGGAVTPYAALNFGSSTVAAGGINFGADTSLYRSAADTLKTDDSFTVGGTMAIGGTALDANMGITSSRNVTDPAAAQYGAYFARTLVLTSTNANQVIGGAFAANVGGAVFNPTGQISGGLFSANLANAATATYMRGAQGLVYNQSTGTITTGVGLHGTIQNLNAAGVITSAYGVYVDVGFNVGTIANTYGVYVGDVTSGTQTNQAYGLYVSDANARNYLAGMAGVGIVPVASNGFLQLPAGTTLATGGIAWGTDANLYRSAADVLKTDDNFQAAGVYVGLAPTLQGTAYFQRALSHADLVANYGGTYVQTSATPTSSISTYARSFNATMTADVPTGVTLSETDGSLSGVGGNITKTGLGTVSQMTGVQAGASLIYQGTLGTYRGVFVDNIRQAGTGVVTTAIGVQISPQAQAMVANAWGLYQTGASDLNYFNGKVGLGTGPTLTTARLQFVAGTTVADGITWGTDTNLYRSAADTLKTDDSLAVSGSLTATTGTFSGAAPQIVLSNATSNWIRMVGAGVGAPTFTTPSAGTKLVLYPQVDASNVDYAIGIDAGVVWNSVPTTASGFKWYGGTTLAGTLSGAGVLTMPTAVTVGTNPATAGAIRLPNAATIRWRNVGNTADVPGISTTSSDFLSLDSPTGAGVLLRVNSSTLLSVAATATTVQTASLTLAEATNVVLGTTSGTKFGTATTQKQGWWNATPVVRSTIADIDAPNATLNGTVSTVNALLAILRTYGLVG